jgi:hypothetical protein
MNALDRRVKRAVKVFQDAQDCQDPRGRRVQEDHRVHPVLQDSRGLVVKWASMVWMDFVACPVFLAPRVDLARFLVDRKEVRVTSAFLVAGADPELLDCQVTRVIRPSWKLWIDIRVMQGFLELLG